MEQIINEYFTQYAYMPGLVYTGIMLFMLASGFGLPLPEELVLISAGFVGYRALHAAQFPIPEGHSGLVNVYVLAAVSFMAVITSDYLIFYLGQRFGPSIMKMKLFRRFMSPDRTAKVQDWVQKYGYFAVILFRFTPGIRFPGHLMCGAMGLSKWRFLAVDTIAAGLSVPTQVLLVAFYGETILKYFKEFKLVFFSTVAIVILFILIKKYFDKKKQLPT